MNGQLLVSGFASAGTGSVQVSFQNGSATFPAVGGVYGGSVSASLGAPRQVLYGTGARTLATRVASTLRTASPIAMGGSALSIFGSVARVVVLVGRND